MGAVKRLGMTVATVALAAAVGLAELVVRVITPQATMYPRYVESNDYAIMLPANATIVNSQGSRWSFTYRTNELGCRGPYLSEDQVRQSRVVVAIGDSFTFGIGVGDAEVYTSVLAESLGPEYSVINGAAPGWGIDSEEKWYYQVGYRYNPEIIVVQFTANDPYDSFTGVASVEDGVLRFHPYERRKPLWQQLVSGSAVIQRSHLYSLARSLVSSPQGPSLLSPSAVADVESHYVRLLSAFAKLVRNEGRILLMVSVTHQDPVTGGYRYDTEEFPEISTELVRLENEGFLQFVKLPLSAMRDLPGSPEGHQWGAGHHKLVAQTLAASIRDVAVRRQNE